MARTDPLPFPQRIHLSALTLTLHYEQEQALRKWARWAKEQVAEWPTPADPGRWDSQRVLRRIGGS
jgi:hypothetical protein